MFIVYFTGGRILEVPKGEARFWAWVSENTLSCNVFDRRGSMLPLSPFDIR